MWPYKHLFQQTLNRLYLHDQPGQLGFQHTKHPPSVPATWLATQSGVGLITQCSHIIPLCWAWMDHMGVLPPGARLSIPHVSRVPALLMYYTVAYFQSCSAICVRSGSEWLQIQVATICIFGFLMLSGYSYGCCGLGIWRDWTVWKRAGALKKYLAGDWTNHLFFTVWANFKPVTAKVGQLYQWSPVVIQTHTEASWQKSKNMFSSKKKTSVPTMSHIEIYNSCFQAKCSSFTMTSLKLWDVYNCFWPILLYWLRPRRVTVNILATRRKTE